ncbi:MAG: hypothetical protein VXY93_13125, partial [Pseudomonadota bacterium]|nr:hypothetical protein [Pseudomonadota bacterium]
MSFLTATNSLSRIKFGDSRQSNRGVIAYSHSADSIILHTVGNEKLRITSGGDILIGRNTGLTDAKVSIQCDAGESGIAVQLNTTTGTSNLLQAYSSAGPNVASITVNPTATPDLMFNVWDGSSTAERLRITSAGNVGIGTDNPSQLLHLEKDSYHRILLKRVGAAPSEAIFANLGSYTEISNNASGVKFSTGSTPTSAMVVRSGGNVGIGTDNPGKLLEIFGTDPTIKLRDSSGDAYVLIEADFADQGSLRFRADPLDAGSGTHIRFDTDGDERLRISSNGDVRVGGGSPATFGS